MSFTRPHWWDRHANERREQRERQQEALTGAAIAPESITVTQGNQRGLRFWTDDFLNVTPSTYRDLLYAQDRAVRAAGDQVRQAQTSSQQTLYERHTHDAVPRFHGPVTITTNANNGNLRRQMEEYQRMVDRTVQRQGQTWREYVLEQEEASRRNARQALREQEEQEFQRNRQARWPDPNDRVDRNMWQTVEVPFGESDFRPTREPDWNMSSGRVSLGASSSTGEAFRATKLNIDNIIDALGQAMEVETNLEVDGPNLVVSVKVKLRKSDGSEVVIEQEAGFIDLQEIQDA